MRRLLASISVLATLSGCFAPAPKINPGTPSADPAPIALSTPADLQSPAAWTEFTSQLADNGDLGWWEASGTTTDVWKTLPGGIDFTYRSRMSIDLDGRSVVRSFTMTDTATGEVVSAGSETIVWDDASKKVVRSQSGFDLGKPWSDSGALVGFDASGMVWEYTERGADGAFKIRETFERTGENARRRTTARADGTGTPFVQSFTRVNFLADALSGWDPTADWITDFGGMKLANRSQWTADGRCVLTNEGPLLPDGTHQVTGVSMMWYDLDTATIRQKYVSSMGMVLDGEVIEISSDRMKVRYTGTDAEGVALHAFVTSVVDGDTMTSQFSDMRYDGKHAMPAWAQAPMTATREQTDG